MYHNLLTGTLPTSLGYLSQLQYLDVNPNQLTGTVPASLGNLMQLQYLNLNNNHFTGTIPFLANPALEQLLLSNNLLCGKLPSLAPLQLLQVLLLQNNHLSGNLHDVFEPMAQLQVKTIVLANNQLTGTLPEAVFQLKLETFVGTSNCFQGPLPISAICDNLNMISFVIDGMSSASSCRKQLLSKPFSAYILEHTIGGSIPACLLQLPNLATLHLSANGFTGSVPSNIQLSNALTDLSLSHNALTGSIPEQMQLKKWNYVDLSFNRLSGTLMTKVVSNGSIDLENNRLSGNIPAVFHFLTNISMLGSNTFYCNVNQAELPKHDPNRDHYQCGSNMFDVLFYAWLGAFLLAAILLGYFAVKYKTILSMRNNDASLRDTNLYATLKAICRISLCCALYSIVVLLPIYAACSVSYGTQTYAYAYQISAVYMSGIVPFALDWCFWWILLFGFNAMLFYGSSYASCTKTTSSQHAEDSSYSHTIFTIVPYLLIDILVVAGVNAAYVYVAVYKSRSLLLLLQTLLSIFKVVWGNWTLFYLLGALSRYGTNGKTRIFTQVAVNLLNNIAIPCLIVAVVSPDCFYNALVVAPTISATVYYRDCAVAEASTGLCVEYASVPVSTTFSPPFTYNYQCSSSLITYYSPAFVSMCIVSTFVTPLAQYLCQWLYGRATVGTLWYKVLDSFLPRMAKPIQSTADYSLRHYLNIDGLMTALISTLGLILTFGVMFPPLCAAFTVSICATAFFFRKNVSRSISSSTQQNSLNLQEIVRAECNSVDAMLILKGSVWLLITVSCWFYTLFLFDTLGDAVGFERAYWVLIVMPLMPLVLYALYMALRNKQDEKQEENMAAIEMQTVVEQGTDVHNVLVVGIAGAANDVA